MFGLSSLPALLQGLAMAFLPSSPRWLVLKKREAEVLKSVAKIFQQLCVTLDLTNGLDRTVYSFI